MLPLMQWRYSVADAPPGARFTFLDYLGLGFILVGGEEILRRPREGWPIWISGFVLGAVALVFRDRSPQLSAWFRALGTKNTSKLVIHSANYAAWSGGGQRCDVTKFIRSLIRGDSLAFGPIENHSFVVDGENLVPHDPLVNKPKRLEVTYSFNGEQSKTVQRTEHSRMTLPEDSVVDWLGSELEKAKREVNRLIAAQPKPSQYPIPAVRLKVLEMVSELQGFLGAHGEEPRPPAVHKEPGESNEDFLARYRGRPTEPMLKWRARFLGDYRQQFKDKVSDLRDEMRSRAHIDDPRLNTAIGGAENESNNGVAAVNAVIERLWELALKVNV